MVRHNHNTQYVTITIHVDRTAHCPERVFTTHNRTPQERKTETRNMTIKVMRNTTQHNQDIKLNTLHLYKIAGDHEYYLNRFITDAIERKALLVLMIDDFHNINTKRRPNDLTTSKAGHMATILIKRFSDGSAIPPHHNLVNPDGISQDFLSKFSAEMMPPLSKTFASIMPYWVRIAFFDPEMERVRIEIHDYRQCEN